jgi:hypothetical protein
MRGSYKKIQNNEKPSYKLSDEQIQRLNDAGFAWVSPDYKPISFDTRINDLEAFIARNGHCNVSQRGEDSSLGTWCCAMRGSYKKENPKQREAKLLSDEQIDSALE